MVRYATYLGGNDEETPLSVAVDGEGNTYVAGCTHSPDFPGAAGARLGGADVFVSKIDRTGANIIYTAFLGGSGWECAGGIAVERDGSAHITGYTGSFEFPVRNAAQPQAAGSLDAFVATLEPSGAALRYSTFLGGSDFENNPEVGPVGNVTIGADGATYVTGHTRSADFPLTLNAVQRQYGDGIDAFVARIDTSLSGPVSLQYSTFLGGAALDTGAAVTVDDLRAIYVTGVTYSPDFPVTAAAFRPHYSGEGDAFVTKIATAGNALAWSTFAGGESLDHGEDVVVDAQGRAYLAAYVTSIDYPTVQPLQTAHGGFFKSNDGARTWNKRNSGLGTSLIKSIVFDPKRPNRVYAGTWRGMYRSDDGGETWRAVNAGLPINAGGTLNVSDVAIDADGVQLFAATWRGLYRSVDGGETWQPRDNGLSRTNEGFVFAIAVEVDPKTPSTVYAASVAPAGGVVFKSIDSGATWTAIDASTPRGLIPLFGQALAVDPKQTSTVYAGSFGSIYRTDDAGTSWRELKNGLPNTSVYQIVVDPENPATVYVATITEVYKSSDRGETWRRASDGIGDGIVSGLVIDPQNPSILYLNKGGNSVGRIASTSTSSIAAGPDRVNGGIFKTTDGGQTWTAVNEGLESNGGGGIAIQPGNSSVIVAGEMVTVDIGLTRFSADGSSAEWSTYFGGRDRDMPAGMVLACGDRLFIGGSTMSDDYPLVRPTQNQRRGHLFHDAFVTELSFSAAAPEVKFSTFAGSPDEEEDTRDLAADCQGNVYLTGRTYSRNFPTIAALQPYHAGGMLDGFLMKIAVDGEKGPTTRRRSVRQ
ncbi:MAG TPA: SBBP repeat-containing protein [Thermoanaerobaculia bacterium]|nr:SBBP repeat-containing protein [Thermoanaerobaculia bacterium]